MLSPPQKNRYTKSVILSFQNTEQCINPPAGGFHPVYIKHKRVKVSSKGIGCDGNNKKWAEMEKIRKFTSNEDSFITKTKNRSTTELLIGEFRSLLNKLTLKTYKLIIQKISRLNYDEFDDDMVKQTITIFINKASGDKDFGEIYGEIGTIMSKRLEHFSEYLLESSLDIYNKTSSPASSPVSSHQKTKCIGLMRMCPYLVKNLLLSQEVVDEYFIEPMNKCIASDIVMNEIEQNTLYIELLCNYCEIAVHVHTINIDNEILHRLKCLKSMKVLPARVRFMIDDTLTLLGG